MELTNLEIEIAVAKIYLGKEFDIHTTTVTGKCGYLPANCIGKLTIFNPLIDDALCFQLMIKYKVDVEFFTDCVSGYIGGSCKGESIGNTTNQAICLAIIEMHNE